MGGLTLSLVAFAFWSLPYCTSKSGGDLFGDSGGEANISSRLFHWQMPARLLSLSGTGYDHPSQIFSRLLPLHAYHFDMSINQHSGWGNRRNIVDEQNTSSDTLLEYSSGDCSCIKRTRILDKIMHATLNWHISILLVRFEHVFVGVGVEMAQRRSWSG